MSQSTEIEIMVERGNTPFGAVVPAVYLCGQCRTKRIEAGAGVCDTCREMLERRGPRRPIVERLRTAVRGLVGWGS